MNTACDILIVGGGVSGLAAAVIASRRGLHTLLLEKSDSLGGTLRNGLNFPICGCFDSNGRELNAGLMSELIDASGISAEKMGRLFVWPCPSEKLLSLFAERMDVDVRLQSEVTGVEEQGGRIIRVIGDGFSVEPRAVIDCSGAGIIARLSTAEVLTPEKAVLAGYSIRFDAVESDGLLPVKVPYVLRRAVDAGTLAPTLRFSVFAADCLKLSIPPSIGAAELREAVETVVSLLRAEIPAFKQATVLERSPHPLKREGVRLTGETVLTQTDLLSGARFTDGVVKAAWPMEFWDMERGQQLDYLPDGVTYEIPARCLKSPNVKNLFAAGRCISVSSEALSSSRVMGTCISLGEAAAKLAADFLIE